MKLFNFIGKAMKLSKSWWKLFSQLINLLWMIFISSLMFHLVLKEYCIYSINNESISLCIVILIQHHQSQSDGRFKCRYPLYVVLTLSSSRHTLGHIVFIGGHCPHHSPHQRITNSKVKFLCLTSYFRHTSKQVYLRHDIITTD